MEHDRDAERRRPRLHVAHDRGPDAASACLWQQRDVDEVFVCGLARDVCVLWTAQDALELGLRASLLWDLSRPVTPDTDTAIRATLQAQGIAIAATSELRRA